MVHVSPKESCYVAGWLETRGLISEIDIEAISELLHGRITVLRLAVYFYFSHVLFFSFIFL